MRHAVVHRPWGAYECVVSGDRFQVKHILVKAGAKRRLENPGTALLRLIEVQSGAYLGKDDIVRFEDTYGWVEKTQD